MAIKIKPQKPSPTKPRLEHFKTFAEHIRELRGRLLWVVGAFLILSGVAYHFRDMLLEILLRPLNNQQLVYLTPGGGFNFIFQVTVYAAILGVAPLLMFHLYKFLQPALPLRARRSTLKIVLIATLLLVLGVTFGYFIAIPAALRFLTEFAGGVIAPNLTADSYLNFFLGYVAGLGLLFQLPLLLLLWHWIKPFTPSGLLKSERFVIIFAFVAAALITPTPDVFNQAMIAVPLILVYQFGVAAILIQMLRRPGRKDAPAPRLPVHRQALQRAPVATAHAPVPRPAPPARELVVPARPRPVSHPRRAVRIDGISPLEL